MIPVLVVFSGFLLLLVAIAAPLEAACRHSPGFAAWLDRVVDKLL